MFSRRAATFAGSAAASAASSAASAASAASLAAAAAASLSTTPVHSAITGRAALSRRLSVMNNGNFYGTGYLKGNGQSRQFSTAAFLRKLIWLWNQSGTKKPKVGSAAPQSTQVGSAAPQSTLGKIDESYEGSGAQVAMNIPRITVDVVDDQSNRTKLQKLLSTIFFDVEKVLKKDGVLRATLEFEPVHYMMRNFGDGVLLRNSVKVGDYIKFARKDGGGQVVGMVKSLGALEVEVKSPNNELRIISNSEFLGGDRVILPGNTMQKLFYVHFHGSKFEVSQYFEKMQLIVEEIKKMLEDCPDTRDHSSRCTFDFLTDYPTIKVVIETDLKLMDAIIKSKLDQKVQILAMQLFKKNGFSFGRSKEDSASAEKGEIIV